MQSIIHTCSFYAVRRYFDNLNSLGWSISSNMTIPLIAFAYDQPDIYNALTELITNSFSDNSNNAL